DNHMPLFHLLSAPLFLFSGDDPRLLFAARLAMIPLFISALALVWRIARDLFDQETAWWSAALVAVCPPFFLGSLEYRTDDLWIVAWLAVIAVLVSGMARRDKFMWAGLFLGIAFGVSMKSIFFVAALSVAFIATVVLARLHPELRASHLAIVRSAVLLVLAILSCAFTLSGSSKLFLYVL